MIDPGFASTVLRGVGAPVTPQNMAALAGWAQAEGGSGHNNPFNTTQNAPGATNFNGVGVKAYPSLNVGAQATIQTLRNGRYGGIISALQRSDPSAVAQAIGASPWGTSGQLVAQTISAALKGHPQIPAGGSYTTGGQTTATNVPTPNLSLTEPTFDQAGYNQALARYKAGSFFSSQTKSSNPYADKGASLGPNPLLGPGLLTTSAPNAADYAGTKQVQLAHNQLQILSKSPLVVHPDAAPPGNYKGYVNPVQGFTLSRTDQGVDANAPAGTPVKAIGDSQLVDVKANWYAGQPLLLFKFLNGPRAGQYWYVAEQINPATTKVGTVFHAGDAVATYAKSGSGIEIGFGHPGGGDTLAQATTGYTEGQQTQAGQDFRNFIGQLGAK